MKSFSSQTDQEKNSSVVPFAKPTPRCKSVIAGLPDIRAYPSAAPVTTFSCRPRIHRTPLMASREATRGISVVPGFAKHTPIPLFRSARIITSAPVSCFSFSSCFSALAISLRVPVRTCEVTDALGEVYTFHIDINDNTSGVHAPGYNHKTKLITNSHKFQQFLLRNMKISQNRIRSYVCGLDPRANV